MNSRTTVSRRALTAGACAALTGLVVTGEAPLTSCRSRRERTSHGAVPRRVPTRASGSAALRLPDRDPKALGGRALLQALDGLDLDAMERRLVGEVLEGNVPPFMRELRPVEVRSAKHGSSTIWASPDYLCVGSDDDYVRVPLRGSTAQHVTRRLGAVLPTFMMVDAIHRGADVKLEPSGSPTPPKLLWVEQVRDHERVVHLQLERQSADREALVAGHMKDVVVTRLLAQFPGKLAIYGLHRPNGVPVQPLSTIHFLAYVDYMQGVRLIADMAELEDVRRPISDILVDPELAAALSAEGPIQLPAYPPYQDGAD